MVCYDCNQIGQVHNYLHDFLKDMVFSLNRFLVDLVHFTEVQLCQDDIDDEI